MYFLIINIENEQILYSSNYTLLKNEYSKQIINYFREKELLNPERYQIGIYIEEDLIFATIQPRFNKFQFKRNDKETLDVLSKKFCEILGNDIISNLKLKKKEDHNIFEKIQNSIFPWDLTIRVIGEPHSGKSSITNLYFAFTETTIIEILNIPYKKAFSGKQIAWKEYGSSIGSLYGFNKYDSYFFLIIDSTKFDINKINNIYLKSSSPPTLEKIPKKPKNPKILIIANKQDVSGAISPEKIEKIIGYPTIGFSAIMPDAPERLEKIISDFLKD